jgi:AmmeMemoRadiSam system protein B
MVLPAIRPLDAFPVDQDGQRLICLRDPEGVVEEQMLLTPPAFFIACHLDGTNDITDIQYAFARQSGGQLLFAEDIQRLVESLDRCGLLQTDRFAALQRQIATTFTSAETRPAYLAGKSYPGQREQLRTFLDAFFCHAGGPGERPTVPGRENLPVRCLIAPHIDFHRGGHSYAHGYLRLFKQGQPDTVFIFGVAHAAPPVPFILTQKHFETPFGVLETDRDIVRRLEAVCTWDPYAYEIVHRTEHSIEFQAVMLSYLYGRAVRIVPILCAAFGPELAPENAVIPEEVRAFLDVCRDIVEATPQRLSVIAGADLAHVGRRFGDPFDIDQTIVNSVEARDREDLQHVLAGDAERFYRSVMQDQNRRRVCGLNCIYAALRTVHGAIGNGELLHYDYAPDPTGGIVSFADILFA